MSQINLKQLLAGDAQQEYIDKLNFNFGQISEFGGGPPGIIGLPGGIGLAGGRGPIGVIGIPGQRGSNWKVIEADPNISNVPNPLPDDLAYNRYTGHLFSFVRGVWVDEGKLVQDGTFFERDGTVFYNLPLHEGIVKSIVIAPIDYRTLNVNPLVGNFRPTLKMLSNNLSNPFITFGFVNNVGFEVQRTKQVGMYLEDNADGYDFILSNASGNNVSSAGPNHFKIGVDNTYRFTASGQYERLQFDLSDVSDKYVLYGGDNDGFTKLIFGSDKQSPTLVMNDRGRVGINNVNPQTQLHVNGDTLSRSKDSVSTPLILGSNVGGGNASKLHFEISRLAVLADGLETDSTFTTLRRVDAEKFSGFIGFTGGLTNTKPTVKIGFSDGPSLFSQGHNDNTVVSVNSDGVDVTGDLGASNSVTIGDRSQVIGKWSLTLGEGTEASEEGSVAIGSGSVSNHKNAVVIGSANSIQKDSVLVANHFSIKKGFGSFQPVDPAAPDYFDSRNPRANAPEFLLYKEVTASLQHDDTINGMEIVNFGPTGFSNDPLLLTGQRRQNSKGMSFMITGAELNGTHPFNIFSVGNDKVTIGDGPKHVQVIDRDTPIGSYVTGRYALSIDGALLFNPLNATDNQLIGSSHVMAPYSLFYPDIVRGSTIIKGGSVTAATGNTAIGGSIQLLPGSGNTAGEVGEKFGYVSISPEEGNVYIGKRNAQGDDKFQVYGSSYFYKNERRGPTVAIGIIPAPYALETVSGLAAYIQAGTSDVDRNSFEGNYLVSGKIAHSWNSISSDATQDIHTTSTAGIHGVIGVGASVGNYAAYFEDLNTGFDERATVKIKSSNLGLSVDGKVEVHGTIKAREFIPTRGWVDTEFASLKVHAYHGLSQCTPDFGDPGCATFINNGSRVGTSSGQSSRPKFQSFKMGYLVMFNFTTIIQLNTLTNMPESLHIGGLPMYVINYTLGTAYVWGFTSNGTELGALCPLVAIYPGTLQIQLPQTSDWGSITQFHATGSITCNGDFNG